MKQYRLLGEVKTIPEWVAIFPYMWGRDFADKKYGFEEVNTVEKEGVAWCGIAEQTRCYSNVPDAAVFLKNQFEILQKSPNPEPSSKKEEREKARTIAEAKEHNQKIMELIQQKKNDTLASMSLEELEKLLK